MQDKLTLNSINSRVSSRTYYFEKKDDQSV
jgi:hypothetical protein